MEDFVYIPDSDIYVKKNSFLFDVFLVNARRNTVEMDSQLWNGLYSLGAECHDIWTRIVLLCHPSLLNSLTRVNKFTYDLIYKKYSLEKWIDHEIREFIRWNCAVNVHILDTQTEQEKRIMLRKSTLSDIRARIEHWYKYNFCIHNKIVKQELLKYLSKHLIPISLMNMKIFGKNEQYDKEMIDIILCLFRFRENKIFYIGAYDNVNQLFPVNAVVHNLNTDGFDSIYLKTQLQENDLPVYLCVPKYRYYGQQPIEVTQYFPFALN